MQIDVFPAYANQKVGAMIMAIAAYRDAPKGVQQLSLSFLSEEVVDKFIREIGGNYSGLKHRDDLRKGTKVLVEFEETEENQRSIR